MRIVLIRGIFKNRFILDHVRNSRPDREHRRNREQDESYHVDDLSRGAGKIDRKEEKKYAAVLESRLIFSQLFRRKHDSRAGRDLTERADDEFPCENNADANRCGDINPVSPKPKNAVFGQHKDKSGGDQYFIGDGIEKFSEIGHEISRTGNMSVERVRESRERKNYRRDDMIERNNVEEKEKHENGNHANSHDGYFIR